MVSNGVKDLIVKLGYIHNSRPGTIYHLGSNKSHKSERTITSI